MVFFALVYEPMFVSAYVYNNMKNFFQVVFSLAVENNFCSPCNTDILFSLNAVKAVL